MSSPPHEDRELLAYLLGRLSQDEMSRIEEDFFHAPALLDRLEAVEEELIDAYFAGELSVQDHSDFERHFVASPRRLAMARLGRGLAARGCAPRQPSGAANLWSILTRTRVRTLMLAAASLAMACGWWIVAEQLRWDRVRERELAARVERTPARGTESTSGRTPPALATFLLTPGMTRGTAGGSRIPIPADRSPVRFRFELPEGLSEPPAAATLQTPEGAEIWSAPLSPAEGPQPSITLPGSVPAPGDFLFVLKARQGGRLASYQVRFVMP
jgi:hypothetical protein